MFVAVKAGVMELVKLVIVVVFGGAAEGLGLQGGGTWKSGEGASCSQTGGQGRGGGGGVHGGRGS